MIPRPSDYACRLEILLAGSRRLRRLMAVCARSAESLVTEHYFIGHLRINGCPDLFLIPLIIVVIFSWLVIGEE